MCWTLDLVPFSFKRLHTPSFRLRLLQEGGGVIEDGRSYDQLGKPTELQLVVLPCGGNEERLLHAVDKGGGEGNQL